MYKIMYSAKEKIVKGEKNVLLKVPLIWYCRTLLPFCISVHCCLFGNCSAIGRKATFVLHSRIQIEIKNSQISTLMNVFPDENGNGNSEKQQKIGALKIEKCEGLPMRNLQKKANVPRSQEDYISRVSEEIQDRITKKLSKIFS